MATRNCPGCGAETVLAKCLKCQRREDKLEAASKDIRDGRKSMAAATAHYGVSSVDVVQWIARRK